MLKIIRFVPVLLVLVLLASCKKSKELTIRFQVNSTSAVTTPFPQIITKVGLGISETSTDFTSGNVWTKTFVTDTEYRPLLIVLNAQNIVLASQGTVTVSIYVNDTKQAESTSTTTIVAGQNMASTSPVSYTVQ